MAHQWYSIQTYGSDRMVRDAIFNMIEELGLQEAITEVIVPTEDVIEVKEGKKKVTERSLYSGYVFCKNRFKYRNSTYDSINS